MRAQLHAGDGREVLRLRLELGELCLDRVRLAAYLGDPHAHELLGLPPNRRWTHFSQSTAETRGWVHGLAAWGKAPLLRACRVAVRAHVTLLLPCLSEGAQPLLRAAEPTVLDYIRDPSEPHRAAAGRLAARLGCAWQIPAGSRRVLSVGLQAVASDGGAVRAAVQALGEADVEPGWTSVRAAKRAGVGRGRLRHGIQRELLPWALGYDDPCRAEPEANGLWLGSKEGPARRFPERRPLALGSLYGA